MQLNGYLLLDKPTGWTSFDVVNKVRHLIQNAGLNTTAKKRFPVGHAGTLDPLATGLMVVVIGEYTKKAAQFSKLDKTYQVTAHLGVTSTTGDEEGHKTPVSTQKPPLEAVEAALRRFTGQIQQVPPQYSAVKVDGTRAYQLARAGKTAHIEPRTVTIYAITEVAYVFPELSFVTRVSSGTYIRTLVEDLGEVLQTGAYTKKLRRTRVGTFDIAQALPVDKISAEAIYQNLQISD